MRLNRIAENLENVKERIAKAAKQSGRTPDSIKLVAVTKGSSVADIQTVLAAGVTEIGENRVQEAQQKYESVNSLFEKTSNTTFIDQGCQWHLIGHLQRNKVKPALEMFSLIHSVDSLRLFEEISRRSETRETETDVLIQVNTTGEASKYGINPDDVPNFIEKSLTYSNVRICGLMTMGKLSLSPEENRPAFALLRTLAEKVKFQQFPRITRHYLSMGMTNDFEIAIEEGANLVRIGRAIFGSDS